MEKNKTGRSLPILGVCLEHRHCDGKIYAASQLQAQKTMFCLLALKNTKTTPFSKGVQKPEQIAEINANYFNAVYYHLSFTGLSRFEIKVVKKV